MAMDVFIKMLSCVETDGRKASHAIVEDEQATKAPTPAKGSAPLLKKITITDIGKNELLILPDKGLGVTKTMSPLLSTESDTDQNRVCDGVLIRICESREDGKIPLEIGYFDLKSGNPEGYSGQFLSTRCFIAGYLMSLLKVFYSKDCDIVRERFVIFHTDKSDKAPSLQKKRTRPAPASANTPKNADKCIVKNEQNVPAYRIL